MFADEIPLAIQWHEGMLLAPQHFQQTTSRLEMLTQYTTLLLGPYCWGVRQIAFDPKLLPSGTLRILELEAILPDGSVATHRPAEGRELILKLAADVFARQREVAIYLALPARNAAGVKSGLARYEGVESEPVSDENTGEGALRYPILRPNLSLMAGDPPPPKFLSMQIARVRFEDETCVLTNYIPPTMTVPAHSPLGEICGELASRVREKAMFISEQVRSPSAILDKPLMMENLGRMQALISHLPAFEAMLATETAHPLALYLGVCGMVGSMAALGTGTLPPVFAPYNHSDLRASFEEVVGFALRMTSEGVPETYETHSFQLQDNAFHLLFSGDWAGRNLFLALRVPSGANEKDIIEWGEECLIGSESIVPSLRHRRIRGAQRQFIERHQDLVPVRGVVLFAFRADPEFVKLDERLLILNPGDKRKAVAPAEVVLYAKRSV